MFLFQAAQAALPAQRADEETTGRVMGIIRAHADRAFIFDLLRLPRDMEKMRADLVYAATGRTKGTDAEYLATIRDLFSRATELKLNLRSRLPEATTLGFFYGYEMRLQFSAQGLADGSRQLDSNALKKAIREDMGQFITEPHVLTAAVDGASLAAELSYQSLSEPAQKAGKPLREDYKKSFDKKGYDSGAGGAPAKSEAIALMPDDINIFYNAPRVVSWSVPLFWTKVSSNMPGDTYFQKTIDEASGMLGITRQGGTFSVPGNISSGAYLDYRNYLYSSFNLTNANGWFNAKTYDNTGTERIVKDVVTGDLRGGASLEQFAAALQKGDFQGARDMLVPGSNTYKAFGDQNSFKTGSSIFSEASLLRLLNFSLSTGAGISYRLGESDQSTTFQIVATGTRDFLVTNQQINNLAIGAWTLMTIKPTKTKFRIGAGAQMTSGAKPSFYVAIGAEQNIPLNKFLRVVVDGTAAASYAQSISKPIYNADIGVGLKAKVRRVEIGIKTDFFLSKMDNEFYKGAKGVFTFDYTPANWAKIGVYGEVYAPGQKASVFTGEQQYVSQDWPVALGLRMNFSPSTLFKRKTRALPGEQK